LKKVPFYYQKREAYQLRPNNLGVVQVDETVINVALASHLSVENFVENLGATPFDNSIKRL